MIRAMITKNTEQANQGRAMYKINKYISVGLLLVSITIFGCVTNQKNVKHDASTLKKIHFPEQIY